MPPKRRLSTSEGGGEDEGITALDGGKKKKKMDISTLMQVFLLFKIPWRKCMSRGWDWEGGRVS